MASSGSITTNEVEGRSLTLSWSLSSQDVANNTSTISWTLKGSGSASGWIMSGGFKAVINGTTLYSTSTDSRIQLYSGTVVASGTLKISHNSDGTKSFSLSCQGGVYFRNSKWNAYIKYDSASLYGIRNKRQYGVCIYHNYLQSIISIYTYSDLRFW